MEDFRQLRGALKLVEDCVNLESGEMVAIVCDLQGTRVAECLAGAVHSIGGEATILIMESRSKDSAEPPATIANALLATDVFFTPVGKSITHTDAVRAAIARGARGLVMTQWTPEMLVSGGINADFRAVAPLCRQVAKRLEEGSRLRLTSNNGTDLTLDISGRRGNALTGIVGKGEFSTIPTIEANVSPIEGSGRGTIVADASIPYLDIGVLAQPVVLNLENGFVSEIQGGREARTLREDLLSMNDPNVYNVAEIGIGLNPCAKVIGNMLEDEGAFGVVHVGLGTSTNLGGVLKASCHYDVLLTGGTLTIDGEPILVDGKLAGDLADWQVAL